ARDAGVDPVGVIAARQERQADDDDVASAGRDRLAVAALGDLLERPERALGGLVVGALRRGPRDACAASLEKEGAPGRARRDLTIELAQVVARTWRVGGLARHGDDPLRASGELRKPRDAVAGVVAQHLAHAF